MKTFSIIRIVWDWPPPWIGLSPGPYDLTVAQYELGNSITVLTGGWPLRKKEQISGVKICRAVSGVIPKLNAAVFFSTAPAVFFMYAWKKMFRKVDIIHAHGHLSLFFSVHKKLFGWLDKTVYVVHLHHVSAARYEKIKEEFGGNVPILVRIEWYLQKLTERLALATANKIIVVSPSMKDELRRHYSVDPEKIYILVNGVNTSLFFPEGEKIALPIVCKKPILFVGNLNQRKNPDVLIKSLHHLPEEYGVVFIGPDHLQGALQKLTTMLELEKRVVFLGEVPNRKLSAYLRSAVVVCLPSSSEGFPKVVLEALACNVPVAASGFSADGSLENLITFIHSLTPEGIANSIMTAEKSRKEKNFELIESEYSWHTRAKELQKLYIELIQT